MKPMPSPVRFAVVRKLLESKGYRLDRVSGSHHVFVKPGVPHVNIPVHRNQVNDVYYRQAQKAP
jgi:predicted RNA binding protein YcfA (HicA-like mRNA interferase family)